MQTMDVGTTDGSSFVAFAYIRPDGRVVEGTRLGTSGCPMPPPPRDDRGGANYFDFGKEPPRPLDNRLL